VSALSVRARIGFAGVGHAAFDLDVDLEFPPGITAILGPSGAGKTTLLSLLAGRLRPAQGRIALGERLFFDAERHISLPPADRRLGYLFQEYLLFPHLTVLENAAFGARATRARALEWLDRLGVAELAPRHPGTLSGGEQQRVALARALASAPDAVLLDEPTAALDLASRAQILDLERMAQRESGVPFVHVSHSPAEAVRVADRAVVLEAGRVVQQGTPLEVLNTPRSLTVARIAGFENILPARIVEHRRQEGTTTVEAEGVRFEMGFQGGAIGSAIELAIRAEEILIARREVRDTSARNVIAGTVGEVRVEQDRAEVTVTTPLPLRVSVTPATVRRLELTVGARIYLLIKARAIHRLE